MLEVWRYCLRHERKRLFGALGWGVAMSSIFVALDGPIVLIFACIAVAALLLPSTIYEASRRAPGCFNDGVQPPFTRSFADEWPSVEESDDVTLEESSVRFCGKCGEPVYPYDHCICGDLYKRDND